MIRRHGGEAVQSRTDYTTLNSSIIVHHLIPSSLILYQTDRLPCDTMAMAKLASISWWSEWIRTRALQSEWLFKS